jgi:hypothetical protein
LRRFLLKGLENVDAGWHLIAATHNLLKLFQIHAIPGAGARHQQRCQGLSRLVSPHDLQPSSGLCVGHPEFLQQHRQRFTQLEPVAGGACEEESALSSKASILDSSAASRSFSFFSSFKRFSLSSSRLSLSCPRISMSYTGRQLSVANKRRQGGKVETHSDLLSCLEVSEPEEVGIAIVRGE